MVSIAAITSEVGLGLGEPGDQPDAHRIADGVDRRVVDGDDADIAVAAQADELGHGEPPGWMRAAGS
jgi:hypothetical protein